MKFQSPFSLLEDLGIDPQEVRMDNLPKLEKRLLLEIDLSGDTYLKAGKTTVTKDDILTLFEQLKKTQSLDFHRLLRDEYPKLDRFLRTGEFNDRKSIIGNVLEMENLEGFRQFVSPYLVDAIRKQINLYFNKRDFRKAFRLLELTTLLTPEDHSHAFDKLAGSLNQLLEQIEFFAAGTVPLDLENYQFLYHDHFIQFMIELPPEFNASREKLAIRLNNLGVQYQKKELKYIYMIFMALRALKCSSTMKETIYSNSEILEESYLPRSEEEIDTDDNGFSWFRVIGILSVLMTLIRACSSS